MDADTIRGELDQVKTHLQRNEEEKAVLLDLLRGYEGWLRLYGERNGSGQVELPLAVPKSTAPKGTVSMRGTVKEILRESRGEPLHSKEIWRRAQELGVKSSGRNPVGLVDLIGYALMKTQPIERVAPAPGGGQKENQIVWRREVRTGRALNRSQTRQPPPPEVLTLQRDEDGILNPLRIIP